MDKVKVCFYPTCENATNHFLANLARLLRDEGSFECSGFLDLAKQKKGEEFRQDVYHFNWFDQSLSFASFLYRFYILLRVIFARKRIVWTIHNTVPHGGVPAYNRILRALLLRFSSVIHIMSEGSRELPYLQPYLHKVELVPHGDYFGSYPECDADIRKRFNIAEGTPIVLFLGAVRPYKNIEILLDAFDFDDAALLICGNVRPREYLNKLTASVAGHKNVIFAPEFVPDSELSAYLRASAFLVAPYSYESALNSGTVLLACSYGKTVVCPDIAGVRDIQATANCLYAYHYEGEAEHTGKLRETLARALDDYRSGVIAEKQSRAVDYMRRNSWDANRSKWCGLFKR